MIFFLESLHNVFNDYGWAIIVLTLAIRAILWPFSKSQADSMRKMQILQPKMKQLQDRHKADPQKLQQEMMKLYGEHKFNPFGGCLPVLIQIPLFLGLYWAISSPAFMVDHDPVFLNLVHLKRAGIVSHGGFSHDGKMTISENPDGLFFGFGKDNLTTNDKMVITLANGSTLERKIENIHDAIELPKVLPGLPLTVKSSYKQLGLEGYEGNIKQIKASIKNTGTTEQEDIVFTPKGKSTELQTTLETATGKWSMHWDVLVLVVLFAIGMAGFQKQMGANAAQQNAQQAQIMKVMQYTFFVFLIIFPLPAGVLLYMAVNSLFQIAQTWWFNRNAEPAPANVSVVDV